MTELALAALIALAPIEQDRRCETLAAEIEAIDESDSTPETDRYLELGCDALEID